MTTAIDELTYATQILENSPDGIFTISTDLEIRYVNPAFCKIVGYAPEELLGTRITAYLVDLNILDVCMIEVAETGRCRDQETLFRRKDGSVVHISKNVQAIVNADGSIKEILVSVRDMTDLHRLNRDLEESRRQLVEHTQQLETTLDHLRTAQRQLVEAEKLASLGGLVAGVAHEINTPLGISITSATAMHEELKTLRKAFTMDSLKRTQLDDFLTYASQACNILYNNMQRASELVNSFKRIAVDQSVDEWREINLRGYCDEILTSLGPKFKERPITVENRCDETIDICTNPGALYQILSNLLLNSLIHGYAADEPGVIAITARQERDAVVIDYLDNGRGIAKENLGRVFEPFFTTRRGQGGSGLGLSIVYNLVTGTLKGAISVESRHGEGVHFRFTLPVMNEALYA